MKNNELLLTQPNTFDLFRLSNSKKTVDVCANTLREYHQRGLPFYRQGKAVFVSRAELAQFIKNPAQFLPATAAQRPLARHAKKCKAVPTATN